MTRDFRSIKAWERAHALTLGIYRATASFPDAERYGLISQMRRSSASMPTNIAEGCGRFSEAELARFLEYASGSSTELEYQLLFSRDLSFLSNELYLPLSTEVVEIRRMLIAYAQKLDPGRRRL